MRVFFTTIVLLLISIQATFAQNPIWQWGRRGGTSGANKEEYIADIATDPNGNVYTLSSVQYTPGNTFDVAGNTLTGRGGADFLVSSFTCTGAYRWSKVFGGISGDFPAHLEADTLGGIYFTARFNNFNNAVYLANDTALSTLSNRGMCLIKYDTAGNYKWIARPQSDTTQLLDNSNSFGLQVDGGGNVYWLAHLLPNSYGNGAYQVSSYSLHVLKYNSTGAFQGGIPMDIVSNTFPTYYEKLFFSRSPKSGKFFIAGHSQYPGPSPLSFGSTNITKGMFLGAFSSTGNSLWTKQNNSTTYGGFFSQPSLDSMGNIYMAGSGIIGDSFAGSPVYTNSYPNVSTVITALSLDSNGVLRWAKNSSNFATVSQGYGTYNNGQFIVAGGFYGNIKWAGLNDSVTKTIGSGDLGLFSTRFNAATGQPLGIDSLVSPDHKNVVTNFVHSDRRGNVYIGGRFDSKINVAGSTLQSAGFTLTDFFLAKYGFSNCNCVVPVAAITQSSYDNAARSAAFQYTGTTTGIDSIVFVWGNGLRLRLTNNFNGIITQYYGTNANTFNVCVTAYTAGCGNNTACRTLQFTPIGIEQVVAAGGALLQLAPNPAAGATEVSYILQGNSGSLEVYDLAGRLLSTKLLGQKTGAETLSLSDYVAGVYMVVLREEGSATQYRRLVIAK